MKLRNLGIALTAISATVFGVVGTANNAFASTTTATVTYSGTVPVTCSFSGTTAGALALNSGNYELAGGDGTIGTPGATIINCNGAATITVADPVKTAGPALTTTGMKVGTWLTLSGSNVVASPGANTNWFTTTPTSRSINNVTENYMVNVAIYNGSNNAIPPGTYSYTSTVTATY